MNIIFYLDKLHFLYYHYINITNVCSIDEVKTMTEKEKIIESIIELLKNCNDMSLLYLILSMLLSGDG